MKTKMSVEGLKTLYGHFPDFNFKDCVQYICDFITPSLETQLKEAITKYAYVKDTLDHKGIENHNVDSIFGEIDDSRNLIEMLINKQMGI